MTRDEIWEYVMTIRENVKVTLKPPKENKKEILQNQRKIVVSFEKKLLKEISADNDFQVFVQSAINCAFGEYEFEDLLFLYESITGNKLHKE